MAIIIKKKAEVVAAKVVETPVAAPTKVTKSFGPPLKGTGVKIVHKQASEGLTLVQKSDLVLAGVEPQPTPPVGAQQKYSPLMIGDRVVITTTMFPWVKHYKPGDIGVVKSIMDTKDALGTNDDAYRMHIISIDRPLEKSRKGGTAALFRREFEEYQPPVE